jgi:phage terminase large subunit-like protein
LSGNTISISELLGAEAANQAKLYKLKQLGLRRAALEAPTRPLDWVLAMYRQVFSKPFGIQHEEAFNWAWNIAPGTRPQPFVAIWSRGFGKSTVAEVIAVMLGAREQRKYLLYCSETQELADSHLGAIRGLIENPVLRSYYPVFAAPKISKEGHSKGWRHNRLYCGNGYVVDAIGLDTAKRGSKILDARPDFMIFDDVDAKGDSPMLTRKKIDTITASLLPAGSVDSAVMFVQNMIIDTGVFAHLAKPVPPFMKNRILSGPFPALDNFSWHYAGDGKVMLVGTPTWAGITLQDCQRIVDEIGLTAFRSEYQHEITNEGSMFEGTRFKHIAFDELPEHWRRVVAVDPAVTSDDGSDSNGITVAGVSDSGDIYIIDTWEKRATSEFTLQKALYFAIKYGADRVLIEGNQGGDMWLNIWDAVVEASGLNEDRIPGVQLVRATGSTGSKMERAGQMLVDYELGKIWHVVTEGESYKAMESALRRFPLRKPYDLVDSMYWAWSDLRNGSMWVVG